MIKYLENKTVLKIKNLNKKNQEEEENKKKDHQKEIEEWKER